MEWIEDLDQPGSRADRPGLLRAMDLISQGAAEGIVVAKLDRFGRSVVQLGSLVEQLRESGGALFSVAEGVDTRGPTGKLIADILMAIAEWELQRIRDNWAAARSAAESRGVYLAEAPVGFTKDTEGKLVARPELPKIAEAFERRVAGESWVKVARWLDSEGVKSRRGGQWTVASVRNLISNRVYVEQGIVGEGTWREANEVRGVAPARSGRASGLLSGILRCAGCRYAMKLSQNKSRHGKPFTEYRCKSARGEAAGSCEASASISANAVEPVVMEAFWSIVGDYAVTGEARAAEVEEAQVELRVAEQDLDAALDTRLADALGGSDADRYIALVEAKRRRVEEVRQVVSEAEREARVASLGTMNLRELWPDLSLYDQRRLLASVLDAVFVRRGNGERLWICRRGEAPELPIRGQRWSPKPFDFPSAAKAGRKDP